MEYAEQCARCKRRCKQNKWVFVLTCPDFVDKEEKNETPRLSQGFSTYFVEQQWDCNEK